MLIYFLFICDFLFLLFFILFLFFFLFFVFFYLFIYFFFIFEFLFLVFFILILILFLIFVNLDNSTACFIYSIFSISFISNSLYNFILLFKICNNSIIKYVISVKYPSITVFSSST